MQMGRQSLSWLASLALTGMAAVSTPAIAYDPLNRAEYLAKVKQAEALFKKKCQTDAGIKIYKTVSDVEGVLLLKLRPPRTDRELADQMWPGAAFGGEVTGDGYIASFIGHEVPSQGPIGPTTRGYISNSQDIPPGGRRGYRWVEAIDPKDGQRYRYSASYDEPWQTDKNYLKGYIRFSLDKKPSPSKTPPRYGVTFEDHVIPGERALWVASSTVKVLDLETDGLLGEMTIYAMSYIHAPRFSMPWLNHTRCGHPLGNSSQDTRKFVDQVLVPNGQPPFVDTQSNLKRR